MREESIRFVWWRHLLVAVGYAAVYALLRSVSVSNWNLPASLRLAALLLVPMRYWPALVLGEAMPVAYQAWLSHGMFGWAWASFAAFPPIALCAPFMAWFRRRTSVVQADGRIDVPAVLIAALACAVLTAAGNIAALASVHLPSGQAAPAITARIVFGYFLGNYLGALTLTPLALVVRGWLVETRPATAWMALRRSGLLRDGAMSLVLPLIALTAIGYASENADAMQVCRIAMFVPVAWLTLRHGWRGAAIGGAAASCAVALTSTIVRDPSVIQAQAIIALDRKSVV